MLKCQMSQDAPPNLHTKDPTLFNGIFFRVRFFTGRPYLQAICLFAFISLKTNPRCFTTGFRFFVASVRSLPPTSRWGLPRKCRPSFLASQKYPSEMKRSRRISETDDSKGIPLHGTGPYPTWES